MDWKRSLPSLLVLVFCFGEDFLEAVASEQNFNGYDAQGRGHYTSGPDYKQTVPHPSQGAFNGVQLKGSSLSGNVHSNQRTYIGSPAMYEHISGRPDKLQFECATAPKVAGSKQALWEEAPFLVSLRDLHNDNNGRHVMRHFCAGSILSQLVILTAASCFHNRRTKELGVVVGTLHASKETRSTQLFLVQSTIPHPLYMQGSLENDIGLVLLNIPIQFGTNVHAILIGTDRAKMGMQCAIYGWDRIAMNQPFNTDCLLKISVEVKDNRRCQEGGQPVPFRFICAKEEGNSCLGDVGAPMTCNGRLFGIVLNRSGCDDRRMARDYVDVYRHKKWIEYTIRVHAKDHSLRYPEDVLGFPKRGREDASAGAKIQLVSVGLTVLSFLRFLLRGIVSK